MNFILTLVSSTKKHPLSAGTLALLDQFLNDEHIGVSSVPVWLERHKAVDIALTDKPLPEQILKLRALLAEEKIDFFIQSTKISRRKKLLIADMDSTIVEEETLDELAAHCGLKDKISAITNRAMKGELDFHQALKKRISMLEGLSEDALKETLSRTKIMKGAKTLVHTMKKHDAQCVLVSGGFTYFTGAIAWQVGFDHHHGNILGIKNKKLTGQVEEPILDKNAKVAFLKEYADKHDLKLSETLAVGDGANDLEMLSIAGLGIGYHPKPLLKEKLDNLVLFGDLTALLYAQGYKAEDIGSQS